MFTLSKNKELDAPPGKAGWPWTNESSRLNMAVSKSQSWPRLSIVTLSYNQGRFIEEAIRSVLLQGYPNLEYIVIDGGSTDGSIEIIQRYSKELAHWSSEPDGGPAAGLNKGFRRATGEIFSFLNADDFYLPGAFYRIANIFSADRSVDVVYGDGYMSDVSGRLRKPIFSDAWSLWRLAYGACVIVQPATFFKREAFLQTRGFNEKNLACWDAGLWVDLALTGATFHQEKESFGVFRMHTDSITGSGRLREQFLRDMDVIFERIMRRPKRSRDHALALLLRLLKFSRHPQRTLGYKPFFHSIRKGQLSVRGHGFPPV